MCFIDTGIQNDGFDWCRDFALCCFWVQFWKRAGEAVAFIRLAREKAHCHRSRLQVCETKHLNRMSAAYEYYASKAVLKEGVCNSITQPHHNFIINLPCFCVGSKTGHKRNSCLFSPTLYWQKDHFEFILHIFWCGCTKTEFSTWWKQHLSPSEMPVCCCIEKHSALHFCWSLTL